MVQTRDSSRTSGTFIAIAGPEPARFAKADRRLKTRPEVVIVVSPIVPAAGTTLHRLMATARSTFVQALPALQAGEPVLMTYSFPDLFSLAPPLPALTALLPGLRETSRQTVANLSPTDLARTLADVPAPVTVWIDLPGAEADLLEALRQANVLQRIDRLELRCGVEPFFVGAQGRPRIVEELEAMGFVEEDCDDDDPDWPGLQFRADPRWRQINDLEQRLTKADRVQAPRTTEAPGRSLEEAHGVLVARDHDLSDLRTAKDVQAKDLEDSRAGLVARDQMVREARDKPASEKELTEARVKYDLQTKSLADEVRRGKAFESLVNSLRQQIEERGEDLARAVAEARLTRHSLGQALDTLSTVQGDLSDLRGRFAALLDDRNRLERLLAELAPRMREAAIYLRGLSQGQAAAAMGETTSALVADTTPAIPSPPKRRSKSKSKRGAKS